MSDIFFKQALDRAVATYQTIAALPDPTSSAAFGVASGEVMVELNVTLQTACNLLKSELDRRNISYCLPEQSGKGVVKPP